MRKITVRMVNEKSCIKKNETDSETLEFFKKLIAEGVEMKIVDAINGDSIINPIITEDSDYVFFDFKG